MRRRSIFSVLAMVACFSWASSGQAAEPLQVGDKAPDFEMEGSDGKTYKLSDFIDKQAIVIAWFPKAFTGGCTKECISFRETAKRLNEFDVAYFTASCDPPEKNKEFAESLKVEYPILSDPDGEIAKQFGIYNEERMLANRVTFYIDKEGRIAHVDAEVKVDQHGEDVVKKLEDLDIPRKEADE
jgi:peroxiredoxin Q/BCP